MTTPPTEPTPARPQGRQINLRAPQSKSEHRLVAKLHKAIKGRDRAERQYVGCIRAIERAAEELERAGMVVHPPATKPPAEAPAPEQPAAT